MSTSTNPGAETDTYGDYPDRGDNCVVCDSTLEFDRYICTTCSLAERFGLWGEFDV